MRDIPVVARPLCPVCSHEGTVHLKDLTDRLFATPGSYTLKKCSQKACGTCWLDPTPDPAFLSELYATYTTHTPSPAATEPATERTSLRARVRAAYLSHTYGHGENDSLLRYLAYIHPTWRDMCDLSVYNIPYKKGGRFLDVGCGPGESLKAMQHRGWRVHGVDFDPAAVAVAKTSGFDVDLGGVEDQKYEDGSFDGILLCNVIEHLPDPGRTLRECFRILAPEGSLTMITPNMASIGARFFGKDWRGLETPQHLQLFTPKSLAKLTSDAGFDVRYSRTTPHSDRYVLEQSFLLSKNKHVDALAPSRLTSNALVRNALYLLFGYANAFFGMSEAIVLSARKSPVDGN